MYEWAILGLRKRIQIATDALNKWDKARGKTEYPPEVSILISALCEIKGELKCSDLN